MKTNIQHIGHQMILWAFYLMLALIAFAYSSDVYAYTLLPKRFALYLGLTLATLGWFAKTRWGKDAQLTLFPSLLPLILLCVWAFFSFLLSTHPLDTLVEITFHLSLVMVFLIAMNTLSLADVSNLLKAITLIGGIVGVLGVLQYFNLSPIQIPSNGPPSATFGYRNFAAMFLIVTLPLVMLHVITTPQKIWQGLGGLALFFMALFLLYTRTRGAWLGFGLGILVITAISLLSVKAKAAWQTYLTRHHLIMGLVGVILLAILGMQHPRFLDTGLQRFDEKKATVTSTVTSIFQDQGDRGRFNMWQNTLTLIGEHPLLGVGLGGWKRIYPHYDNGAMVRRNSTPVRPHNDYLWLISELGLIGFGLVMWFAISFVRALYAKFHQSDPFIRLTITLSAISIMALSVHACFSFPKEQPQAIAILFLICGLLVACQPAPPKTHLPPASAIPLFCGLFIFGLGATTLTYFQLGADHHYLHAHLAEKNDDWNTVSHEVEKSLGYGTFRPHIWAIKGRADERQGQYQNAEEAYQQALAYAPYNWQAHNGLGIVYKRQQNYQQALAHYQTALSFFPGATNYDAIAIRTNLGALHKSMGNIALAEKEYQAILQMDPRSPGAHNNMGNIYKARGEKENAKRAYLTALESDSTLVQAHINLASLYLEERRPQEALMHAYAATDYEKNSARVYWTLARILEANLAPNKAIEAHNSAIQVDSTFAQAHFDKANLLFDLKRYDQAQQSYQRFIESWTGGASFIEFATKRIKLCYDYHKRQQAYQKKSDAQ